MKPFDDEPAPVIGFLVRFSCGALFGAIASLGLFYVASSRTGIFVTMVIMAIVCGLFAAFCGDKFWEHIE